MVLFFDLFAQEHCGGFGEHGLFIGTKLGIVVSHECHCACYIAVCEDRGDGEGVGSGDQLRNTHTDGNDAGVHGVFQDMFYQNGSLRETAYIGIKYIILFHIFKHIVADQADIGGNVA